jgi:hypothetical protein
VATGSKQGSDRALAVREEANALDDYARQYMSGHGAVLHSAKIPAPKWLQFALASMVLVGLGLLFTPMWVVGLVDIPIGFLLWSTLSVLRFTVSEGAVKVQYGLFGPTIPTSAIQHAEAIDYDWKKFGGWGIRRSLGGESMYNMPGDGGHAVRIVWTDAKGKRCVTNIGTRNPEAAVVAIAQARRALPPSDDRKALEPG